MKYFMALSAIACFGFSAWSSQFIASDVQLILVANGVIGGMIFVGLAGVLDRFER